MGNKIWIIGELLAKLKESVPKYIKMNCIIMLEFSYPKDIS